MRQPDRTTRARPKGAHAAGWARAVRAVVPPVLVHTLTYRRRATAEWQFLGHEWPRHQVGLGWSDPSVADVQLERLTQYTQALRAPSPLTWSQEAAAPRPLTYGVQNTNLVLAYCIARAARMRESLVVLDCGGGLGSHYHVARALFPDLELNWTCLDLPPIVAHGRAHLPSITFLDSPDEALAGSYDFVLASSSLQYFEAWATIATRLAASARDWLLITRQPVVIGARSYVTLQRPHSSGYMTHYPGWVINRDDLLCSLATACRLEREFLIDENPFIPRAPQQPQYRGFLFSVGGNRQQ